MFVASGGLPLGDCVDRAVVAERVGWRSPSWDLLVGATGRPHGSTCCPAADVGALSGWLVLLALEPPTESWGSATATAAGGRWSAAVV